MSRIRKSRVLEVGLQRPVELVGGAEEQAALQFDDGGAVALGGEDFHFGVGAHALGEGFVAQQLAADDGTADLLADEQHHGKHDADAGGRDQAHRQRRADHRDDDQRNRGWSSAT
jgi:hypothetical protein